jgi:hypothetical protein
VASGGATVAILAALGVALAASGSGATSAGGDGAPASRAGELPPGVAAAVYTDSAPRLAELTSALPDPLPALADSVASRAGAAGPRLLQALGGVQIALVASCPPPALLGCRPALAATATFAPARTDAVDRSVAEVVEALLSAQGFRELQVHRGDAPGAATVTAGGREVVARWRIQASSLRLATGGLPLAATRWPGGSLGASGSVIVDEQLLSQLYR